MSQISFHHSKPLEIVLYIEKTMMTYHWWFLSAMALPPLPSKPVMSTISRNEAILINSSNENHLSQKSSKINTSRFSNCWAHNAIFLSTVDNRSVGYQLISCNDAICHTEAPLECLLLRLFVFFFEKFLRSECCFKCLEKQFFQIDGLHSWDDIY